MRRLTLALGALALALPAPAFARGEFHPEDEFKLDYLGGYGVAPEDIRDAILDLVQAQYVNDTSIASDTSSGTAGVTSEKIGDFSYSLGSSSSSSASSKSTSSGGVTDITTQTLQRYKRRFA